MSFKVKVSSSAVSAEFNGMDAARNAKAFIKDNLKGAFGDILYIDSKTRGVTKKSFMVNRSGDIMQLEGLLKALNFFEIERAIRV